MSKIEIKINIKFYSLGIHKEDNNNNKNNQKKEIPNLIIKYIIN